jgi:ankyrin repeat protein
LRALIAAGAEVNAQQKDQWAPLHLAAQNGHVEVARALIAAGADMSAFAGLAGSPLLVAIGRQQREVANLLVTSKSAAGEWAPQEKATALAISKTFGPSEFATEIAASMPVSTGQRVLLWAARMLWGPIILSFTVVRRLRSWIAARICSSD